MDGSRATRKRKLREAKRKLSDIAEAIETIAFEEKIFAENSVFDDSKRMAIEKDLVNVECLFSSVHAIYSAIALIDPSLEQQ